MNLYEKQIQERRRLDQRELEDSYARLAGSVMGSKDAPHFTLDEATISDDAIEIILGFYGQRPADVPDDVIDPYERMEYALRPSGIMKRPVRLVGDWWRDATGAYLGKLKEGGPVAVVPTRGRGYSYVDPATGEKVRVNKNTAALLDAEALCFYRPLPQHELSLRDVIEFMFKSLKASDYAFVVVATLVATLLGMLPTIAYKLLFDGVIPSGEPSLILPIGVLLVGIICSQALIRVTNAVINARFTTKLQVTMEAATYARVMLLQPSFFKNYAPGDLAHRVSSMSLFAQSLSQNVLSLGLTCVFSFAYLFQIFRYTPALTVPAFITMLLELVAVTLVLKYTIAYNRRQMQAKTQLSGVVPSLLHGVRKIKLAGAEKRAFSFWARRYAEMSRALYDRPALLLAAPALIPLIASGATIAFYGIAATSNVSVADYMAFNYAFGMVSGAVTQLAKNTNVIARLRPLLEMVEPIMKAVPEALSSQKQVTALDGSIEVANLSFRYAEKLPLVLDKVSLKIRPGEYVAIVGTTGCGKSTLMRLMLGFETPTSGAIYYGDQNLASVDARSLRKKIGVVMQNGNLFAGDLFANITIMNPRATIEDAWEAAELAGIAEDIRKMPQGMQTLVSEGSGGVSGGQRQRIMIARAVCNKPRILMLDEATSALDNITQKHVSDALASLKCTRIVIAHRLSTIRQADRIVMLSGGHIVEDGSYDELVSQGGLFAELVARQQLEQEA